MALFHLLNTGYHVDPIARRRLWVVPNQPVHLVSGVRFCIRQAAPGLLYTPVFEFSDPDETVRVPLAVQIRADLGLVFIPRAMELGARRIPVRFLVEIALAASGGNMPGLSLHTR